MEQTPHKKTKLTGLIVAVIAIAALAVLFGTLCTCTCTCARCLRGVEWLPSPDDPPDICTSEPTAPITPEPTAASALDGQNSVSTEAPVSLDTQSPADWVRPKKVQLKGDGTDTVTVLVLMNGSDLESRYHEATNDLTEMIRAGKSERVNILVETVGTRKWSSRYGVSSLRSERYLVTDSGLTLVDGTLGQLDATIPSTLSDFIRWGAKNYPADRYILLLWDHGGGPVYGFGYDEFQSFSSTLTIDEMQIALKDGGVYFDLIGMDCCLMSSLEVCCALYEYCDYTLLSEDFEPDIGWSHEGWLSALSENPAIATPALAKIAIDDSVRACEAKHRADDGLTLALVDESFLTLLYPAWVEFAYANEQALLSQNYSQLRESNGRAHPRIARAVSGWGAGDSYSLQDYCITDILSVAANISSRESDALCAALDSAIVYYGATANETTLAGLSVTLPYGDRAFYNELRRVFLNAGFDGDYIEWLGKFVSVETGGTYYDFGDWSGWDDYIGGYDWSDWLGMLLTRGGWDEDWAGGGFSRFFEGRGEE